MPATAPASRLQARRLPFDLIQIYGAWQFVADDLELGAMSALFDFNAFLTVVLLIICTCTYVKCKAPRLMAEKTGFRGLFWKAARIGERLSPWVALACILMGVAILVK